MKLTELGEIIAERELLLSGPEAGSARTVRVVLGKPQPFPDSPDYYCPYQIKGIGDEKIRHMGGVDGIQAIQLALQTLGAELQALNQRLNGKLRWNGNREGSLGFPGA